MKPFDLSTIAGTKYLFLTGKGGVGKTSVACATAVGWPTGAIKSS